MRLSTRLSLTSHMGSYTPGSACPSYIISGDSPPGSVPLSHIFLTNSHHHSIMPYRHAQFTFHLFYIICTIHIQYLYHISHHIQLQFYIFISYYITIQGQFIHNTSYFIQFIHFTYSRELTYI